MRNPANLLIPSALERKFPINIRKGESIHHPQHGIGKIQSIGERSFGGCAKATYAELYFERQNLKLTILKDDVPNTVRSLISSKEAKRLLNELKDYDGKVSKQWKARANKHQAAIDRGDPFETARVFKSLSKLESQDGLRAQDKAHLAQSLELLTEELACTLRKSPEQTRKLLADVAS